MGCGEESHSSSDPGAPPRTVKVGDFEKPTDAEASLSTPMQLAQGV